MRRLITASLVLLAVFVSIGLAAAQGVTTLTYGTTGVGSLSEASPATIFVFNGNAGELAAVQVTAITPGMSVSVSLLGSAQQALGNEDSNPFGLNGRTARVTARLPQAGVYSALVSGSPGDFIISLDSRTSAPLPLQPGTPSQVVVGVGGELQYYSFSPDPAAETTLQINSLNGIDFVSEIYDGTGRLVIGVAGGILNACFSLPPGGGVYEMSIVTSNPNAEGLYSVALVNGGCGASAPALPVGATPVPSATPQTNSGSVNQPPVQIAGVCTASSNTNTNIRGGPGTNFDVVGMLVAGLGIEVTGQTSSGWYAVRGSNMQGYIAMSVVRVLGPCSGLPIVQGGGQQTTQQTPAAALTGTGQATTAPPDGQALPEEVTPAVS
jgi:hypothetical protein